MSDLDRIYFATRAAEELERSLEASSVEASLAHRRLHRAMLERASIGDRPGAVIPEDQLFSAR